MNFDEIYTTGFEINSAYKLTDNLNISAGYQLLYAFDKQRREDVKNDQVFVRDANTGQSVACTLP